MTGLLLPALLASPITWETPIIPQTIQEKSGSPLGFFLVSLIRTDLILFLKRKALQARQTASATTQRRTTAEKKNAILFKPIWRSDTLQTSSHMGRTTSLEEEKGDPKSEKRHV